MAGSVYGSTAWWPRAQAVSFEVLPCAVVWAVGWATCTVGTLQMLKLQPLPAVITHINLSMVFFFFPRSQILVSLPSCAPGRASQQ